MSTITAGLNPQNLRPGIFEFFGNAYPDYPTLYDKVFDVQVPEERQYEETVMNSYLSLATVKPYGSPVTYDSGNQLYTTRYTHVEYGNGFVITQQAMDDGVALKMAVEYSKNLKLMMLRTREVIAALTWANGFSSTLGKMEIGDGVQTFSSAHPIQGGTMSNVPTSAVSLSEAGMEQAVIDIMGYVDNRNQIIASRPTTLLIPLALQMTARRILNSVLRSGGDMNDINVLRDEGFFPGGIVINPFLTSTTNWFVRTDQPGMKFLNRKEITMSDDNEFDTENRKFKALMRFSLGPSDPRATYGVNA